jgi:hypothetical protein
MRRLAQQKILLSVIAILLSISTWALSQEPPAPRMATTSSSGTPPPPPGLPIDNNIYFLATAGLALGIYLFRPKKIS